MEISNVIGGIMAVLFGVYIAFLLTQSMCSATPSYCTYGWGVFSALVIGAGIYLKYKLFD